MSIKTIKDNSVLAKLFAEEDIHISYKQVPTADRCKETRIDSSYYEGGYDKRYPRPYDTS